MIDQQRLIAEAKLARQHARAPYSNYHVGAALVTDSGKIYHGCNIESGAYSTTICAERVAIFAAIAAGETKIASIAIITRDGGTPCGSCRQVIHEQCGDIPIYIAGDNDENVLSLRTSDLLPKPFDLNDA